MTDHSLERDPTLGAAPVGGAALAVGDHREAQLSYESGLEVEVHGQWYYARKRFLRHRLAVVSLIILVIILGAGLLAPWVAPYGFEGYDVNSLEAAPSLHHPFGTDLLGRDYFSRVLYGIRTSERVAFIVMVVTTVIGTAVGIVAGYYSRCA